MVAVASDVQKRSIGLSSKKNSKGPPTWHPGLGHVSGGVRGAFLAHFWLGKMGHFSRFFRFFVRTGTAFEGQKSDFRGPGMVAVASFGQKRSIYPSPKKNSKGSPYKSPVLGAKNLGTQISKIFKLFSGPKIKLLRSWPDMSGGGSKLDFPNFRVRTCPPGHPDTRKCPPGHVRPVRGGHFWMSGCPPGHVRAGNSGNVRGGGGGGVKIGPGHPDTRISRSGHVRPVRPETA